MTDYITLYRDKKWLQNQYWTNKLSTHQIAEICNIAHQNISYWMEKFGICHRTKDEGNHLSKANYCKINLKAIEWINGELLGDGGLSSRSPYSARFRYASKYREYIDYICDTLKSFGLVARISKRIHTGLQKGKITYSCQSLDYVDLLPIYQYWYPEGKKIVPKDLKLTPITCRQWYIGDGHLGIPSAYIILFTNGFLSIDVKQLIEKLNELGFKSHKQRNNTIYISTYSTKNFLDYIGKCPVNCYQYKWGH